MLLVHGMMSLRDRVRFPEIADALAKKGVSSLRFDFTGNGDSCGTFRYANSFEEARPPLLKFDFGFACSY